MRALRRGSGRLIDVYIPIGYTDAMSQSTVFTSNKSQAVRLPKAVALPEHVRKVEIIAEGNRRVIVPAGGSWADFFDGPRIDDDFLNERNQPRPQRRDEP
jgi:antitoxin VapB